MGVVELPKFPTGVSSFFLPFVLSSSFFFPNPNNLLFPCFTPSPPVSLDSASASLLSADLDVDNFDVSWKPSPSRGTFDVVCGPWAADTGVLACSVLASEALILNSFGLPTKSVGFQECAGVALDNIAEIRQSGYIIVL
jgi:hypothetical protein